MRYNRIAWTWFLMMVVAASGLRAADSQPGIKPDGYVLLDHFGANTCLALRVSVPQDEAVSGLRWVNGAAEPGFANVLVASGCGLFPPALSEAVVLSDSVPGVQEGWSELTFNEPVGSSSGSLFLILQYPTDYTPLEGITPISVGFQTIQNRSHYFISDDGMNWIKVGARCRLMMEPVFCLRDSSMLVKSALQDEGGAEEDELPAELGLAAYPNPFNPQATIRLALPQPADCSLKIFDIRGRLIKDFRPGFLDAGYHAFVWKGRDDHGQQASSGVYFAHVKVADKTLNQRLIMIK